MINGNLKTYNMKAEGILNGDDIKEEDVLSGKYNFADIEIFLISYKGVSQGIMNLRSEAFNKVTLNSWRFIVKIRGFSAKLERA
ncbi:baseplate hub domain-containing protein [Wolbachia endosymbiont of Litomosoides brasiliensis]|uniref:baseplate hub domain-containing protein n=1 Tax=Wolbachia endosymbiont of Litomosoides brasiliensis TaxID=1812117 RepID=UPI001FEB373B|nr:DUF2163 domain-containing protein [Wolbachia endosymbiont of Litomosoides brasiliensis]